MALDILLTNDDGFDSDGIRSLRQALLAAGHNVTVVAPLANQSGQGSSLGGVDALFSPIDLVEQAPGVFSVDGKPVVASLTGLGVVLADNPPDLVISGTNAGANSGPFTNISGTVNAAVAAILQGLPAIAVSADPDAAGEYTGSNASAAAFTVDLLARLEAARAEGAPILPKGTGLNVNVPGAADLDGIAVTTIDDEAAIALVFAEVAPGIFARAVLPAGGSSGSAISEGAQLQEDRITVSVLDGNWTSSEADRGTLETRLAEVLLEPTLTPRPLKIMLTNDDGFDAPGIRAVRAALVAAGHEVTIVAPATQQSAIGTALTLGAVGISEFEIDGTFAGYAVQGTPATAVSIGLSALLTGADRPDLVISGTNEGQNIGLSAVSSGTVSAAVTALRNFGLPSIAISTGIDATGEVPDGLFELSADVLVELVDDLVATAGPAGALMPTGQGLNVNVPAGADPQTFAFTVLDDATPFDIGVDEVGGVVQFVFGPPVGSDNPNSEGQNFLDGAITITPLDGNYQGDLPTTLQIAELLEVTFGAPTLVRTGTSGIDIYMGEGGQDRLSGLGADDILSGGFGDDVLVGGTGNDELDGGAGDDRLFANAGNDELVGGVGHDDLLGQAGDDVLNGGGGLDILRGHAGADIFVIEAVDSYDLVVDFGTGEGDFVRLVVDAVLDEAQAYDPARVRVVDQGLNLLLQLDLDATEGFQATTVANLLDAAGLGLDSILENPPQPLIA